MKYCSKCGRLLPENENINHCQICGAKIENKISYDNTNSLLRQNVDMNTFVNNSQKQDLQSVKKNTSEHTSCDSKADVVSEKTNVTYKKANRHHLAAEEQEIQEAQSQLDLSRSIDSSASETEKPVVEEQAVQEEQPELDLSGLLDSSDAEIDEPVVEEQEVQEEQPELDLSGPLDSSEDEVEEPILEEQEIQEEQPELDLSGPLNSSEDEAEEPILEEQEIQEEQPELDLSGLLDSSDAEIDEPVVEEQEVQEEQPELYLQNSIDKSKTKAEEHIEDVNVQVEVIKESNSNLDKTITTEQDENPEKQKQDEIESEDIADNEQQVVLHKELRQHYQPRIDFSDIDPMFGEAPTFDAEAIQRAYSEFKKTNEIRKDKKPKKLFGKHKRS